MKKTIGIIGGMGPMATADLFSKIIKNTPAKTDQEHLHILIDNNTSIPDRTSALLNGSESPLPELIKSGNRLITAGADFLIMPCNTAHGFFAPLQKALSVPVLNMIELTMKYLDGAGIHCAGLLATSGTIETGIYQSYAKNINLLVPDNYGQKALMDMIYNGIKAGIEEYDASDVQKCAEDLISKGAETLILGCTELPLAYIQYHLKFPITDPTLILARSAIEYAI